MDSQLVENGENFRTRMVDLITDEHEYIIAPRQFDAGVTIHGGRSSSVEIDLDIDDMEIFLSARQLPVIAKLGVGMTMFARKYAVRTIPLPRYRDSLDMWGYVHEAAKTKMTGPRALLNKFAEHLLANRIYMRNFKRKEGTYIRQN